MKAEELLKDNSFTDLKEIIEASTVHFEVRGHVDNGLSPGSMVSSAFDSPHLIILLARKRTNQTVMKHSFPITTDDKKNVENLKEVCDKILMTLLDTGLGYLWEKKIVIDGEGREVTSPIVGAVDYAEEVGM